MSTSASKIQDKISQYLGTLPEPTLIRLLHEIRGGEMLGEGAAANEIIADAAMTVLTARYPDDAAVFAPQTAMFLPVLPFLVPTERGTKFIGRVRQNSLKHLWVHLARDCDIDGISALSRDAALNALDLPGAPADPFAAISESVVPELRILQNQVGPDNIGRARLIAQIGGNAVAEDLADIAIILERHDVLSAMERHLPSHIEVLSPENIAVFETAISGFDPSEYAIPVTLLMTRMAHPTAILRILLDEEKTDDAAVLARSRFAVIVEVLLNELSVLTDQIAEHINVAGRTADMIACLRKFHDIASGLTTSISLEMYGEWLQRLAQARRRVADITAREIEQIPARLRLAIQPGGGAAAPDPKDVEAAVVAAKLLVAIRPLRSELALNETVSRINAQVESLVDAAARGLPQQARSADGNQLAVLAAQFTGLCCVAETLFGSDYSRLLQRSGQVAGLQNLPHLIPAAA